MAKVAVWVIDGRTKGEGKGEGRRARKPPAMSRGAEIWPPVKDEPLRRLT